MSFVKIIQPSDFLNGVQVKQLRHQISDLVASGVDITAYCKFMRYSKRSTQMKSNETVLARLARKNS